MENKKDNLKGRIYNELKEKIIFSELLPGSVISEDQLCESFNVSRTPVREALLQLQKDGYVMIEPRKSTKVSKISFQEMNEIIEIRLMVETHIVSSLTEPLDESYIQRFEYIKQCFDGISINDSESLKAFLNLDFEFHSTLISLSKNKILNDFCAEILQRSVRQWYLMYVNLEQRMSVAKNEHQAIIESLIKGDFAQAAKDLEQHIRAFYDMLFYY